MRKPDPLDIIKLYVKSNSRDWNLFLTQCYRQQDIEKLCRTRSQLQAGMDLLVKRKIQSEALSVFFIRLQNSIENTIRRIIREKDPNPCDNPLTATAIMKEHKSERDLSIERYLRKTSY